MQLKAFISVTTSLENLLNVLVSSLGLPILCLTNENVDKFNTKSEFMNWLNENNDKVVINSIIVDFYLYEMKVEKTCEGVVIVSIKDALEFKHVMEIKHNEFEDKLSGEAWQLTFKNNDLYSLQILKNFILMFGGELYLDNEKIFEKNSSCESVDEKWMLRVESQISLINEDDFKECELSKDRLKKVQKGVLNEISIISFTKLIEIKRNFPKLEWVKQIEQNKKKVLN